MPIAFMLIMSLALSRDQDPHTDSRIALVGAANDSVNTALAAALEKEQIHVTLMSSEKLTDAQNGLHDKRFQLVLHNPNAASDKIADNKALQIYVPPDTEPSWLAAVKGVLQQHYTQTRLDDYFDNNDGIKIDNKKLPRSIRKDIQKKVDEKNDEQFAAVRSFLDKNSFSLSECCCSAATCCPKSACPPSYSTAALFPTRCCPPPSAPPRSAMRC